MNSNKILSIVITFCDRDQECIKNMLVYLDRLTFKKEIVFVDDRKDKSLDIKSTYNIPDNYKLVLSDESGENVGTFEARRTGLLNCTGDYVWFVDVDDEPLDFNTDLSNNKVLYIFNRINHCTADNTDHKPSYKIYKYLYHNEDVVDLFIDKKTINLLFDVLNNEILNDIFLFDSSLSNRIFRRDLLLKSLERIKKLKGFCYGEDLFLNLNLFEYLINNFICFDFRIQNKYIYKYNVPELDKYSDVNKTKKYYKSEQFKRYIKNCTTYFNNKESIIGRVSYFFIERFKEYITD